MVVMTPWSDNAAVIDCVVDAHDQPQTIFDRIGPKSIVTAVTVVIYHPSRPQMKWWLTMAMVFVCVFVLCGQKAKNKLRAKKWTFHLELGRWTAVMVTVVSGNDSSSDSDRRSVLDDCMLQWQTAAAGMWCREENGDAGKLGRRIMHLEVRGEVVLSPLASAEPYGTRNTTKAKIMLFPLEGGLHPSA